MTPSNRALALLAVAAMGLWGCTQGPTNRANTYDRIKAVESKCAQLDEDLQAASQKLAAVEEERTRIQQELEAEQQAAAKERADLKQQLHARTTEGTDLKQQLQTRTTERDAISAQFESFRNGIRDLLGQADTAASPSSSPSASKAEPTSGKS